MADAFRRFVPEPVADVALSGGGAENPALFDAIVSRLSPHPYGDSRRCSSRARPRKPSFALLGHLFLDRRAGNVPTVTGARGPRVLGKLTPASELSQLLIPSIRWDPVDGFDREAERAERSLTLGVGGFILFGGTTDAVGALTRHLLASSNTPLLIMSDLERGAGQQFAGATGLPPLGAVGAIDDEALTRAAARLTAREAAAVGVRTVLAPVADVDLTPQNPIVGTRAFGSDVDRVARQVHQWIDSCQAEGVMACAKHFPGHGRTVTDSHAELPVVTATEAELLDTDLMPFRSAVRANVAAIMTAHVAYPALDYTRAPATLSRRIMRDLLRDRLGFNGIVMTDAMIMSGVLGDGDEGNAGLRALDAGCDLLLYPQSPDDVVRALEGGIRSRALSAREVERSLERRYTWGEWCASRPSVAEATPADREAARQLCARAIRVVQGDTPEIARAVDLIIIDDDVGGPYQAPSRQPLLDALRQRGVDLQVIHELAPRVLMSSPPDGTQSLPTLQGKLRPSASLMVLAFNDIRAWKGMPGFSAYASALLTHVVAEAERLGREAVVVTFCHPRLTDALEARCVVNAWGGELPMQLAVAEWLRVPV
ncbi:MAG: anhydro-N-acetylmuramic acid kinase [Gemmatimonadaceae bacterium]